MSNIIYVAIRKDNQRIIEGARWQAAFSDIATLNRSMAYVLRREARQKGVKASELYSVHEIDVTMLLPRKDDDA